MVAFLRVVALAIGLLPVLGVQGARAEYANLFVFGDSLSDQGNLRTLSGGLIPAAPTYPVGTFSNGPTWAGYLSQSLGLGPARPSLLGGTDYAYGLARTDSTAPGFGLPAFLNLPGQVTSFIDGPSSAAGALFAVWAGANNMLQALAAAPGQADPAVFLATEAQAAAANLLTQLERLRADGAEDFLVLNLPDLGRTPRLNTEPQTAAAGRAAAQAYNAALAAGLAGFDAQPGVEVRQLDVFGLFDRVFASPASFGFTDVTTSCVTGPTPAIYVDPAAATIGCTPGQAAATLFWDPIHPTTAAHQQIAIAAAALVTVPEPGTLGLVLVGVAVLVAVRRWA
ncbi:SGNH/GDSL hydrolase family protein [Roseomonas sp. CCTCC AB2023176]|uniref:SGNH/GDSL hydrolase family protein n=1 Tax=Roseomonas sp. CCTCC AB2023176 TaxID=3342640 RepID=UPI0035D84F2F